MDIFFLNLVMTIAILRGKLDFNLEHGVSISIYHFSLIIISHDSGSRDIGLELELFFEVENRIEVNISERVKGQEINEITEPNESGAFLTELTTFFIRHIIRELEVLVRTLLDSKEFLVLRPPYIFIVIRRGVLSPKFF